MRRLKWKLSGAIARSCIAEGADGLGVESLKYISLPHGLPIRDRSILWASMIQNGVVISARPLLKAKERVMPALRVKRKMSCALRAENRKRLSEFPRKRGPRFLFCVCYAFMCIFSVVREKLKSL